MAPLIYEDDDSSSAGTVATVLLGAVAGFAVGMLVAQRVGGFSGLAEKVRRGAADAGSVLTTPSVADDFAEYDEDFEDELADTEEEGTELEERVLEAFSNDPMLSERAVDIGGIGEDIIELAGWVNSEEEAEYAVTLARGVPGVGTVLNRMTVGDEEARIADHARAVAEGDDAHIGAHWEGHTVGTGRKRQGTSDDLDRHSSPKNDLAERWSSADAEMAQAAEDTIGLAERRRREKKAMKGDRTGGAPVAPGGVPKADHVADPTDASAN